MNDLVPTGIGTRPIGNLCPSGASFAPKDCWRVREHCVLTVTSLRLNASLLPSCKRKIVAEAEVAAKQRLHNLPSLATA